MKKRLLLAGLLFGTFLSANAQVIYEGTFENEAALTGWNIIDADGDTNTWFQYTANTTTATWGGVTGNFAASRSWNPPAQGSPQGTPGTPLTPNNFIISPVINLPAGASNLTFNAGHTYFAAADGNPEELSVYITTLPQPTAADLTATAAVFNEKFTTSVPSNTTPNAQLKSVDLTAYAGQSIRIAFRHHNSNNQELLLLDNVKVNQGELNVNSVLSSKFSVYPNPATNVVNVGGTDALVNNVSIVDLNGRTVKSAKFDNVSEAQINISDLSAGVYMMNVASDKGSVTKKIVKN